MNDRVRGFRPTPEEIRILRETGEELRDYGIRIAERGYEALLILSPNADLFTVRFALHPRQIAPSLQKSWRIISAQTERALISAGILTTPMDLEQAVAEDLALGKARVNMTVVGVRDKALAFMGERYAALDFLGSPKATQYFEPSDWTALIYTENASLRGVYYQGLIYNDNYIR